MYWLGGWNLADFISVKVLEETESTSCGSSQETLDKSLLIEVWRDLKAQARERDGTNRLVSDRGKFSSFHSPEQKGKETMLLDPRET